MKNKTHLTIDTLLAFIRAHHDGCTVADLKAVFDAAGTIDTEIFGPSLVLESVSDALANILRACINANLCGALGSKIFPLKNAPVPSASGLTPYNAARHAAKFRAPQRTNTPKAPLHVSGKSKKEKTK
jgi:hypothetical protein